MKINRQFRRKGFTLVEIMGAVLISMVIILLLYKVFDKVQSVFVVSLNRARAMEQGRIIMDMLVMDFQALNAAALNDDKGEVPNIDWGYARWDKMEHYGLVDDLEYPQRVFHKKIGYILKGTRVLGALGNKPPPIDTGNWTRVNNLPDNNKTFLVATKKAFLVGVVEAVDNLQPSDIEALGYSEGVLSQGIYRHHCRFFTKDEYWRFVDYTFGGRDNYKRMTPASPVGALWVYRSRPGDDTQLVAERQDHEDLIMHDRPDRKLFEPVGYARVLDGVIHFRVRAVSPRVPARVLASTEDSIYTRKHKPSHVEVELAVADEKLVREIEVGIEQRMEGKPDYEKYQAKLKHLSKNLGRVYFYKQLIRIKVEEIQ